MPPSGWPPGETNATVSRPIPASKGANDHVKEAQPKSGLTRPQKGTPAASSLSYGQQLATAAPVTNVVSSTSAFDKDTTGCRLARISSRLASRAAE